MLTIAVYINKHYPFRYEIYIVFPSIHEWEGNMHP